MDKVDMGGFGLRWPPETGDSEPFSVYFEGSGKEAKRLFGFLNLPCAPERFGRALALKNFWTYLEVGR